MSFKDLNIKACYESGVDEIVEDFYAPVLSHAIRYDRIAGFFSSSSLAIVSRGISAFIKNGGKMRLITSPRLQKDDAEIITAIIENDKNLAMEDLGLSLDSIEDEFTKDHVKALGWLLNKNLLEIKFAIVYQNGKAIFDSNSVEESGLFHQKVGILSDIEDNQISFSGSINESASAWVNNDEEFKVFKEWTDAHEYFVKDKLRFDEIWNGKRTNVKVYRLPDAVKNNLIRFSSDFDIERIAISKYKQRRQSLTIGEEAGISLFFYQENALKSWRENEYSQMFEMATGTGKTRTAIAGMSYLFSKEKSVITVISCPQNTLAKQWKKEVESLGVKSDETIIVDGTNHSWRKDLRLLLLKIKTGVLSKGIIYTVHNTCASNDFTSIINTYLPIKTKSLFIGDEAHWLGARVFSKSLLDRYDYRIGLSATPSRWFDDAGTDRLFHYFGNKSFEFTIKDALTEINPLTGKHFLVNFYYYIHTVQLNGEESLRYKKICERLSKLIFLKDSDPDCAEKYDRLLEQRADIIKNASEKYSELEKILNQLQGKGELEDLIIFVSPQQLIEVQQILAEKNILFHKLTQEEGTSPEKRYNGLSEREFIIKKFVEKQYKVLIAIKCLDEGIDIPSAKRGILMASSTNPREYIQRIGRIIRQAKGKGVASLYDICVSSASSLSSEERSLDEKIRSKEITRLKEISTNAINSADALRIINEL